MTNKMTNDYPSQPICELNLCESRSLCLKPNQIYLFRVAEDCEECKRLAAEALLKGPTV